MLLMFVLMHNELCLVHKAEYVERCREHRRAQGAFNLYKVKCSSFIKEKKINMHFLYHFEGTIKNEPINQSINGAINVVVGFLIVQPQQIPLLNFVKCQLEPSLKNLYHLEKR